MRRRSHVALAATTVGVILLSASCASESGPTAPSDDPQTGGAAAIRVLMVTATAGFRHDSIGTAARVMVALGAREGFAVTTTEDLSTISTDLLRGYRVLAFVLTSGELPLSEGQRAAISSFVAGGGGFLGVHSATDTLDEWPEYLRLVGAHFLEHPWTQTGTVVVEDQAHPAATGLGERFSMLEEFYTFRENPRPRVHVLLRLDAASVGATGDYPLAWTQSYGTGRVYYNALGHFSETWNDPRFQRQLAGAVRWLAGVA